MKITIQKTAVHGWANCMRLSNDQIDLIATTDVGPRVIRCGFLNTENEFKEYDAQVGQSGGQDWRIYGGHRLWHAPEAAPRSYAPDNEPVHSTVLPAGGTHAWEGLRLTQNPETATGIQKELEVRLAPQGARVEMVHRLRNCGPWAVELAPWALSVMAPGGRAILPLPPRGTHPKDLSPTNSVTLWAFTDLSDPRWVLGFKYFMLKSDPEAAAPQKIGMMCPEGWLAYARNGRLFVKTFQYQRNVSYADFGCSLETFTNHEMLEIETLGPLTKLEPGATVEHTEEWRLFKNVPEPRNDADIERHVLPLMREG